MIEQGWSANPKEVLRYRVVRALESGEGDTRELGSALNAEPQAVAAVIDQLVSDGLADKDKGSLSSTFTDGGWLLPAGDRYAAEIQTAATSPAKRSRAAVAAMLDWFANHEGEEVNARDFAQDVRASFFGEPFDAYLVRQTDIKLHEHGLTDGLETSAGLIRASITTTGVLVHDQFGGDLLAWRASQTEAASAIHISGSNGVNIAANSPGVHQSATVLSSSDRHDQIVVVADALDQMRPILHLTPEEEQRAVEVAGELREVAESPTADTGRLRGLLNDARDFGIGSAAGAAGTGLVAIVEATSRALGF